MIYTIVGSGFGLYGYMPAILRSEDNSIVLPKQSQARYMARPELQRFHERIEWVASRNDCFAIADAVVVATTPEKQYEIVNDIFSHRQIRNIILEKPLAKTPDLAEKLMNGMLSGGKRVRINYSFARCAWTHLIEQNAHLEGSQILLNWKFLAHHFRNEVQTWKRIDSEGGGVLRFYGIHLIALLAKLGYNEVKRSFSHRNSQKESVKWEAVYGGQSLADFSVCVDTMSSSPSFDIFLDSQKEKNRLIGIADPFDLDSFGSDQDRRIDNLCALLDSFSLADTELYKWYQDVISLWRQTESAESC